MRKRVIITEEQLKNVVNVVKEQQFDDAVVKYQQEKAKRVSLTQEDAALLLNLSMSWCQDKREHPDCEEIYRIKSQIQMYG